MTSAPPPPAPAAEPSEAAAGHTGIASGPTGHVAGPAGQAAGPTGSTARLAGSLAEPPGRTTVSERAVRRIAAQAAREVDGVEPDITVQADVSGEHAVLRVRMPIRYPLPVARVTEDCRRHLIGRASELAGVSVTAVDIVVTALVHESRTAAARSAPRVR
ncbi:hypothetical protein [Nocardia sp. NPDC020380]|uniref:hypothetical protein n=1 Tax=Nocardia sp. NPDC020380 TaxID=3364309 RepID=UPI00379A15FB